MSDEMPTVETYRGVPIHAFQSVERIASVVKPQIDRVLAISDAQGLFDIAADPRLAPEARLLAAAKVRAGYEFAAASRTQRPDIELELLGAHVAGLDSLEWTSSEFYGSDCDPRPGAERRPRECRATLEAAQRAAK